MESSSLKIGTIIKSPTQEYKIERVLGAGGFGITYQASCKIRQGNVSFKLNYAIKEHFMDTCYRDTDGIHVKSTPSSQRSVSQSHRDFLNEAKKLQEICRQSPNIVKVNEAFEANGTAYYVMEYLDGGNPVRMSESEAVPLICSIAKAVEVLHRNMLLHLDIKPDNIVMKKDDSGQLIPVLIDFGLTKHFDKDGNPTSAPNAKGKSVGYAPIEQQDIIDEFEPTLDVYALGATLLYLLTGSNPPSATKLIDPNQKELKKLIPENISEATRNAILKAMHPNRNERTQTASNFIENLSYSDKNKKSLHKATNDSDGAVTFEANENVNAGNRTLYLNNKTINTSIFDYLKNIFNKKRGKNSRKPASVNESTPQSKDSEKSDGHNKIGWEAELTSLMEKAYQEGDYRKCLEYARTSSFSPQSQYRLGCLYDGGLYVSKDIPEAFKWYLKAAENGQVNAMACVASMYQVGEGISQDYKKSFEWYLKAAEKGNVSSMTVLGYYYEEGLGTDKDYQQAFKWYEEAALKGDSKAMHNLGDLYYFGHGVKQDDKQAMRFYEAAVENGNSDAMYSIGTLYYSGDGVEKDYKKAMEFYLRAAGKGNTDAMVALGRLYSLGEGVEQDYSKALEWYTKAAEKENTDAMNDLGDLYSSGEGVEQDYSKALEWYTKAAENGDCYIMNYLGDLYYSGVDIEQDYSKAFEWYTKAAEKGNVDAMCNLGDLYSLGIGISKDNTKAKEWYKKAAELGDERAQEALKNLQ